MTERGPGWAASAATHPGRRRSALLSIRVKEDLSLGGQLTPAAATTSFWYAPVLVSQ
jgi:hypothetical protein